MPNSQCRCYETVEFRHIGISSMNWICDNSRLLPINNWLA